MFLDFLINLRAQNLNIGMGQWLAFLDALGKGLATDVPGMYELGRALLCKSETEYDQYDVAFGTTFNGVALPEDLREKIEALLKNVHGMNSDAPEPRTFETLADLLEQYRKTLQEQEGEHNGGNRWVGTGGTSPYGRGGRNPEGMAKGDGSGNRSGFRMPNDRRWKGYRGDRVLDVRDLHVVLRALRSLAREGRMELDLDGTIDATCHNGGEIDIIEKRERKNRLKIVLMMDAGGSMAPHAEKIEKLFTAAKRVKSFRSLDTYTFHNCVYNHVYTDIDQLKRKPTSEVLANLDSKHRVIFVGDASMAPYELFSSFSWPGNSNALSGVDWLRRLRERCPASIWLNPDPQKYWKHPTVSAIGGIFPMFELTVDGVRDGVRKLRAPS